MNLDISLFVSNPVACGWEFSAHVAAVGSEAMLKPWRRSALPGKGACESLGGTGRNHSSVAISGARRLNLPAGLLRAAGIYETP